MVSPGDEAPSFELPAVVDGEVDAVSLENHLSEGVVVLAFYPGDFNPACSGETTGLDHLDLFTMQKDVSILAVSGDSVYSHRAFAAEYGLHVPLLADVRGEVAAEYGLRVDDSDAGYLIRRAVVVIGPDGDVEYTWQADDLQDLPDVDAVRSAVEDSGDTDVAEEHYRVGHAHYTEGLRAFTSGTRAFEEREWVPAESHFSQAHEEFATALDQFNTAVRFADDGTDVAHAEDRAEALWQATEWLSEAASAYASGDGARGKQLQRDAESRLETARGIDEPPETDAFRPGVAPEEWDDRSSRSAPVAERSSPDGDSHVKTDEAADDEIGEAELEEITAELKAQTESTQQGDGGQGESTGPDDPEDGEFDLVRPVEEDDEPDEESPEE